MSDTIILRFKIAVTRFTPEFIEKLEQVLVASGLSLESPIPAITARGCDIITGKPDMKKIRVPKSDMFKIRNIEMIRLTYFKESLDPEPSCEVEGVRKYTFICNPEGEERLIDDFRLKTDIRGFLKDYAKWQLQEAKELESLALAIHNEFNALSSEATDIYNDEPWFRFSPGDRRELGDLPIRAK